MRYKVVTFARINGRRRRIGSSVYHSFSSAKKHAYKFSTHKSGCTAKVIPIR